ncbi:hypothetical protein [Streptomyces telluris]|uniref:Flp family type IVb pilin n=1 Tax=Streptomyces telluris TaxID=2720021 RepID=A0A9X2RN93_9ACTN|nr:hypothetical protein [Streptomyces telluris]MCQ8770176.1 hypothetical protein [Streptomyces telluris]NJP81511.1 hypothetical protein [Streptomyces telluris]
MGNDRFPRRGRLPGNDRGQTAIEYLGIIAVVVAIVLVLTRTDFGSAIASAISDKISEVTSG